MMALLVDVDPDDAISAVRRAWQAPTERHPLRSEGTAVLWAVGSGPVPTTEEPPGAGGASRSRAAVVSVCVAIAVVGMNMTAVGVATRGMAGELGLSLDELSWVMNAYLVAAAAFALSGGRLGDVIGRTRTFLAGLGLFAAGSAVAAVSGSAVALIAGRTIQGLGAAFVVPASIEMIVAHAPPSGPRRWLRARGIVYASSFGIGPLLGGVLTDTISWRAVFWVELAVTVIAAALAVPVLRRPSTLPQAATRDLRGALLVALLVSLVMVGVGRARVWGWTLPMFALVGAVAVTCAALVYVESRVEHPLLHRSLLRDRTILGANTATLAASIGMLGLLWFFNVFAQSAIVFNSTAVGVTVALVPFTLSIIVFAHIAGFLSHRMGFRGPVVVGLGVSTVGFHLLSNVTVGTTEQQLVIPLVLCGIGAGIANAGLTAPAVLTRRIARMDEAAGLTSLTRFFGSAIAVAVGTSTYLAVAVGSHSSQLAIGGIEPEEAILGHGGFSRAAATLQSDLRAPFEAAARAGTVEGFTSTMRLTSIVVAVLTLASAVLLAPTARFDKPEGPLPETRT